MLSDPMLVLTIVGIAIALLSLVGTIYYNRQSETSKKPHVTGKFHIEKWPLITPVPYIQKHGIASTFRIRLELFNLSVPPRTLFLREVSIHFWPAGLPFLVKTYPLGESWLGDIPENAHKTISPDSIEEFRINPDPFIKYFRWRRWPGSSVAEISLIDETGSKHAIRIPIDKDFIRELKGFLTREEYLELFQSDSEKDT